MILPDVNILVHAYNPESTDHRAARLWWEETIRRTANALCTLRN
jgi:predicted nucleic acid-binding protein